MQNMEKLREHLFATLQGLRDGSVSIDTAKAIRDVSQVMVETAKVEVDYLEVVNGSSSEFLGGDPQDQESDLPPGITGRIVHKLR